MFLANVWKFLSSIVVEITVASAGVTFIGLPLALIGIRRSRAQQKRDHRKDQLALVSSSPVTGIDSYTNIYRHLFAQYGLADVNDRVDGFLRIDGAYFKGTAIRSALDLNVDRIPASLEFPILSRRSWLTSTAKRPPAFMVSDRKQRLDNGGSARIQKAVTKVSRYCGIPDYPVFLKSLGKEIWDAPTYSIAGIQEDSTESATEITLDFILGTYFDYVRRNELMAKHLYLKKLFPRQFRRDHIREAFEPKHRQLIGSPGALVSLLTAQPTKLGISSLLIMKTAKDDYAVFVQKRKSRLVEYPGFFHVVPAGTFQPLSDFDELTVKSQMYFEYTILRELLEEVFDLEEADRGNWSDPFKIFGLACRDSKLEPGRFLLDFGAASSEDLIRNLGQEHSVAFKDYIRPHVHVRITGLMLDLLSLKPEMTGLVYIDDPEFFQRAETVMKNNWEAEIKRFGLTRDGYPSADFERFLARNLSANAFLPAGAVALAEGLTLFAKEYRPKAHLSAAT